MTLTRYHRFPITGRTLLVALGLCTATAVWTAPTAGADVVDVTVYPGLSSGPSTPFGAGCTYLVVARTTSSESTPSDKGVSFVDSNQASTFFPSNLLYDTIDPYFVTPVIFDHAVTLWTPTAAGEHAIMAYQTSAGGPIETVTVNPATPIGPGCLVAP